MCSQPPKRKDYLYWDLYLEAASLIPGESFIGISGGEPTLYKNQLLDFLVKCIEANPSLQINVLTNAQHFDDTDIRKLTCLNKNVLWGVPLYSPNSAEHDEIVGKEGAFQDLLSGFNILQIRVAGRVKNSIDPSTNFRQGQNLLPDILLD